MPNNSSRRHISATALMPFNSGRALPSKWDDAERWITSPVSGYGIPKTSTVQSPRQPKSKSGPLGSHLSTSVPVQEGGSTSSFIANSPFTTGVLVPDGLSIHYGPDTGTRSSALYGENGMARASTAPGLSDFFTESSLPSSEGTIFLLFAYIVLLSGSYPNFQYWSVAILKHSSPIIC